MTTPPARPLLHSYEGADPYELIPSPWGEMERWRADAMATGELSALTALTEQVRNDAAGIHARLNAREAELNARADAISARELQHAVSVAKFTDFVGKASVLFDRVEMARADAQEEPLASPPGHKSEEPEPSLELEDEVQPAHGDPPGSMAGQKLGPPLLIRDQDEPPAGGVEFPTGELPHPPVEQQPISAGLDDEEFEEEKHGDRTATL